MFLYLAIALLLLVFIVLRVWRGRDHRADRIEMVRLIAGQPAEPETFSAAMVDGLPEPAVRFFNFAIAQGTPLKTVAVIEMEGKFSLGTKEAPDYQSMQASQVLAAPEGFIWKMSAGSGLKGMSGSDSASWTRFWMAGIAPVARAGETPDHKRAAFGRCVAEAVIWSPAALLPRPGVIWQPVSKNVARVVVTHDGLEQSVEVMVEPDGRPSKVALARWSDANPEKKYQIQPFGGVLSEFRDFEGFCLPTHVEAGNFFATDDYFPFYIANVTDIRFPQRSGE